MTGEMHASEVTRENYPLYFAVADALPGATVKPFDQYQGPYIAYDGARVFLNSADGVIGTWHDTARNESSREFFAPTPEFYSNAIDAALDLLNPVVPVLFRRDRRKDGEVTAVFPTIPGSPGHMTCYAHIGQHGSCSAGWLATTRPATEAEYASLRRELESAPYGYRLRVVKRITQAMRRERAEAERH